METQKQHILTIENESLQSRAACPERYEIKSLIGEGGMGSVFHAFDRELGRQVAIKILSLHAENVKELNERFLRETKVLALLDHPNVVKIYSSGINKENKPYYVMEHIEGVSLSKRLLQGSLSSDEFLDIFIQICAGLSHAHNQKIIHRDLKPSNIMCLLSQSKPVYKLIDFGIARIDDTTQAGKNTLTRTDAVLGTPHYISPEQCRGEKVDAASDIYSLACIMFECISNRTPFEGETCFQIMYKHMSESPPVLDDYLKVKSAGAERLSALLIKCLQKDPAARPQSAEEISKELKSIRQDSKRIEFFHPFERQAISTKSKVHLIALIAGLCLLVILVSTLAAQHLKEENKKAASKIKVSTEADRLAREIAKKKSKLERWQNEDALKTESARERYFNDLLALGRDELNSQDSRDHKDALINYEEALKLASHEDSSFEKRITATALKAKAEYFLGDYKASAADFENALSLSKKLGSGTELQTDILIERSVLFIHLHDYKKALSDLKAAIELYERGSKNYVDVDIIRRMDHFAQHLDKGGLSRGSMLVYVSRQLACRSKSVSSKSAVEIAELSYWLAKQLASYKIGLRKETVEILRFSLSKLTEIEGHEKLKTDIVKMLGEIESKIKRKGF